MDNVDIHISNCGYPPNMLWIQRYKLFIRNFINKKVMVFLQNLVKNLCAHYYLNLGFWGCLRPIWPQKSHISSFLIKYHISNAFEHLMLLRGHFAIDQFLLQKQWYLASDLRPQYSFEANEITLWANWLPLTNTTSIWRTKIFDSPEPGYGWFSEIFGILLKPVCRLYK